MQTEHQVVTITITLSKVNFQRSPIHIYARQMSFKVIDHSSSQESPSNANAFAAAVLEGLSRKEKQLPSWLIFDDKGSEIFSEIVRLETYTPAISENSILHTNKKTISDIVSSDYLQLIELGAGDGTKTMTLIEQFLNKKQPLHFFPIDISAGAVKNLVTKLESRFKDSSLSVTGVIGDYFQGLEPLTLDQQKTNFVLYLGLTLGNQDIPSANAFLKKVSGSLNSGDFMMAGFDLFSNPKSHYRAYNDPEGLFSKFNLHLLDRINEELKADFDKNNFAQEAHYNWRTRAVESYVYSLKDQTVKIEALNKEFYFKQGEGMQTEHSHKYTLEEVEQLAKSNGFEIVRHLFNSERNFVNSIWRVKRQDEPT